VSIRERFVDSTCKEFKAARSTQDRSSCVGTRLETLQIAGVAAHDAGRTCFERNYRAYGSGKVLIVTESRYGLSGRQ
jgi:hypothetical protein